VAHIHRVHLDFEAFSEVSIKKVGTCRYAEHPSTEVLCAAYALDDGEPRVWTPGDDPPRELFDAIEDGYLVHAWNVEMEIPMWREVLRRRFGWPRVPLEKWRDTAAASLVHALPAALDDAGAALGLEIRKDQRGKQLIQKLCKPRRPSKNNPATRWTPRTARRDFEDLYAYCSRDVEAERAVGDALPYQDLAPIELEVWRMTLRSNLRGWAIDADAVEGMIGLLDHHAALRLSELADVTRGIVTTSRQVDKARRWLRSKGLDLPDLKADTVKATLERADLEPRARRLLEIRRELAMSSVAKYKAMALRLCGDGTVKNNLLHHGAATGRDAGRGIQIQNFPRKSVVKSPEGVERAVALLKREDPARAAELICGSTPRYASEMLRSMLTARPGQVLYTADFAQIENRITVWYAGCAYGIGIFEKGLDEYKLFAAKFYGVDYDAVTEAQRDHAKRAVLGFCLAGNTPILTHRGWVRIVEILDSDLLWDGIEWVGHGGVVSQGEKEAICLEGTWITPDHEILTPGGWHTSAWAAREENTPSLLRAIDMAISWLPDSIAARGEESTPSEFVVTAGGRDPSTLTLSAKDELPAADSAPGAGPGLPSGDLPATDISCLTIGTEPGGAADTGRCSPVATTRGAGRFVTMAPWEFRSALSGETAPDFSDQSNRLQGGKIPSSSSIESTPPETTSRETSNSSRGARTLPVYDVLDAGPRRRFTILTDAGPLIVHNCFGMGEGAYVRLALLFGQVVTEAEGKRMKDFYRGLYSEVVQLWHGLNRSAMRACRDGGVVRFKSLAFEVREDFLFMRLASGRELAYYRPKVMNVETPWGEARPAVTHMGFSKKRQWVRLKMTPGRWTENAVQATARDVLMECALEAEALGYRSVGRVHDELVSERAAGTGDLAEFVGLMRNPPWLRGIPITAEGWTGRRYRK